MLVSYNGSYLPCQKQCSLQSVSQDASWQLLLSALDNVPCDVRPKEVENCQGEEAQRERDDVRKQIQRDRDGVCVWVLSPLSAKGEKCWTSQSRMSHQQYMSGHEHFSFTWGKGVYRLCVCLWFNLRKLVRYWTLHHVINLTLLAKAFRLSLERCDNNAQTHTCSHTTRNVLMHYSFWLRLWAPQSVWCLCDLRCLRENCGLLQIWSSSRPPRHSLKITQRSKREDVSSELT